MADLGEGSEQPAPLFWVKKEEMPAGQVNQDRRPPPPSPIVFLHVNFLVASAWDVFS